MHRATQILSHFQSLSSSSSSLSALAKRLPTRHFSKGQPRVFKDYGYLVEIKTHIFPGTSRKRLE